jgi:hypothetical protein
LGLRGSFTLLGLLGGENFLVFSLTGFDFKVVFLILTAVFLTGLMVSLDTRRAGPISPNPSARRGIGVKEEASSLFAL